jgi:predicted enzyme related to lactoylglutathione lyase
MSTPGSFFWYELLTSDVDAARRFYAGVVGWQTKPHAHVPGYHLFATADTDIAGLMAMDAGIAAPVWLGYIAVSDVDATLASVQQDGATQCVPPTDIPGVGRFAMLLDPQRVAVYVMRSTLPETGKSAFAALGHCQWNELATSDPAAALGFYTRHFGWRAGDAMPMGPLESYQFLLHDGVQFGAIMKRSRPDASPLWRFYFGVDDIDRASRAIIAGGGRLLSEPQQVPGGSYAVVAIDPQGAEFGVAGPRSGKA